MSQQRRPVQQDPRFRPPSNDELQKIIVEGDVETLISVADRLGCDLANNRLTTSQIRAIFSRVRELESRVRHRATSQLPDEVRAELLLLRPKLAYQAARFRQQNNQNSPVDLLRKALDPAIQLVGTDPQRFTRFVQYFEAILAYHRFYGGRES